jgi:predicted PhzF superfamily epimerase YddE/YHI9
LVNQFTYMAVLETADGVRAVTIIPGRSRRATAERSGVTAPGDGGYDIVSRYFAPAKGVPEDPVTGAAHCTLAPYWARRLGKTSLHAYQASPRGGEMDCTIVDDRVELRGDCVFYLQGEVEVSFTRV